MTITIFIAPPGIAKLTSRYICLLRSDNTDEDNHYYGEDSLVELSKVLGDKIEDWPFVENKLAEEGIFQL